MYLQNYIQSKPTSSSKPGHCFTCPDSWLVQSAHVLLHSTSALFTLSSSRGPFQLVMLWRYLILRGFTLRCLSCLSLPGLLLPCYALVRQQIHQRPVHPGPLVLRTALPNILRPRRIGDRNCLNDRTSELQLAYFAFNGREQPNLGTYLAPKRCEMAHLLSRCWAPPCRDVTSLGVISLLSLW